MPLSGEEMLARYLRSGWRITRTHRELKKGLERKPLKRLGPSQEE